MRGRVSWMFSRLGAKKHLGLTGEGPPIEAGPALLTTSVQGGGDNEVQRVVERRCEAFSEERRERDLRRVRTERDDPRRPDPAGSHQLSTRAGTARAVAAEPALAAITSATAVH